MIWLQIGAGLPTERLDGSVSAWEPVVGCGKSDSSERYVFPAAQAAGAVASAWPMGSRRRRRTNGLPPPQPYDLAKNASESGQARDVYYRDHHAGRHRKWPLPLRPVRCVAVPYETATAPLDTPTGREF